MGSIFPTVFLLWGDFWAASQKFRGLHIYYTLSCPLEVWSWWMELKKQQIIHFSWKEKIGDKGSSPESQSKQRGEGSYLDSFRCPAYQHVRGSVVMKLKFLKQDQQLEWNTALIKGTIALKISFIFNWIFTSTPLHGAFLLIKYQVEQYSVHPILPSHPDKTQTISLRSQVKPIKFSFCSFQETEII